MGTGRETVQRKQMWAVRKITPALLDRAISKQKKKTMLKSQTVLNVAVGPI